jgi:hypothetical protein
VRFPSLAAGNEAPLLAQRGQPGLYFRWIVTGRKRAPQGHSLIQLGALDISAVAPLSLFRSRSGVLWKCSSPRSLCSRGFQRLGGRWPFLAWRSLSTATSTARSHALQPPPMANLHLRPAAFSLMCDSDYDPARCPLVGG